MSRELNRIGEFGLIRRITRFCPTTSPQLKLGIGDDAAVLDVPVGRRALVTTDMLVEQVDFDPAVVPFDRLGEKALAVNLSDIAAMGGDPLAFFIALGMPSGATPAQADRLYRGLGRAARRYGVALAGGDVSASPSGWVIAVTVVGLASPHRILRRDGARVGDRLCVTGTLGDAGAGLEALGHPPARALVPARVLSALIERHLRPVPRLACGRLLASRGLATAAIDLSDGLASDIRRLCEASGVGAEIDLHALPLSSGLTAFAAARGRDPVRYALTAGEDFELLFTVPPAKLDRALDLRPDGVPITPVGRIIDAKHGVRVVDSRGRSKRLTASGYEHFRS